MKHQDHAHPCNFRLARTLDRGWGELAVLYHWDSTSGNLSDLEHSSLFEYTHYDGNPGSYNTGVYTPPDPPCTGWHFRTPTDGRTAPVALGCFTSTQGWAWDRHKLPGRMTLGQIDFPDFALTITAYQEYRFQCALCSLESIVPGPHAGPHTILREIQTHSLSSGLIVWRYSCTKHVSTVFLDMSEEGYVADSADIGFGPWDHWTQ